MLFFSFQCCLLTCALLLCIFCITSTWFGSNLEYVHGIQMMPITPATALLFMPDYVAKEWPLLANLFPHKEEEESKDSKDIKDKHEDKPPPVEKKECSAHPKCKALGMEGDCCPAIDGTALACCEGAMDEAFKASGNNAGGMLDEWANLMYIDQAVVDREAALARFDGLTNFGPGNSKSNSLFWAMTRPVPLKVKAKPVPIVYITKKKCVENTACAATFVQGECCPSDGGWNEWGHYNGTSLGCCPRIYVAKP